ncbi:OmpA family protein [Aestuariibaculum sp. M13]|uniref:OmpA/MotB family protein n=1 Tax=Aestuariibaculum sp. M13 TaxID=2967132 RepID=UPI002159FAB6|nr:OmpA family protein [Aestuariibaculum sp. M13]MCR8666222.1 OmpA family protein [Aestuariibaculum sp. M13]
MARNKQQDSYWISFSDIMTGLMVIFMFIALNYIIQIIEYKFVEQDIYNALQSNLKNEIDDKTIELSPDGTVRFNLNTTKKELFITGDYEITSVFDSILKEFTPKYLKIITSKKYLNNISEIRIEGHTDTVPPKPEKHRESYDYNLELSSNRARAVLKYIRESEVYLSYPDSIKTRLDFLFTANGLSYSRALNNSKGVTYLSQDKSVNNDLSRRVEFKIVTSNEKLVEQIVKKE